ncbi:MAG TPA: hypothetical protein VIL20_11815 [Sandaracinaceae bacterium]
MATLYAEGGNYRIELDASRIASCRVWRRPDVDSETGAAWAREKVAYFDALASGDARAMIFDLRDAPPVTGPKTQEALGKMVSAFERHGRRIAIVTGPSPVQRLQLQRIVDEAAPTVGRVVTSLDEARAWATARR